MKKIMFNDRLGLTMAVLNGLKTQTRRMVPESTIRFAKMECSVCGGELNDRMEEHSFFLAGEEVAIAQCYKDAFSLPLHSAHKEFLYRSMYGDPQESAGWTNKMFIKSSYMPHHIRIMHVHVEHLQDITDEDCLKEGISRCEKEWGYFVHDNHGGLSFYAFDTIREAFAALIDKVSGKGTWDSNPLVYVYDIKCID